MNVKEYEHVSTGMAYAAVQWRKVTHRTYEDKRAYVVGLLDALYQTSRYTGMTYDQCYAIAEGIADQFEVTL